MLRLKTCGIPIAILFSCFTTLVGCDSSSELELYNSDIFAAIDEKLDRQFGLYEEAREKIIQRVVEENGVVEREEWDAWLTPEPGEALDEEDLEQLAGRQQQTIRESRQQALASSSYDLDLIRNDPAKLARYCSEFPKGAMLHIHPSGTRNRQTVKELLAELNPLVDGAAMLVDANNGEFSILYAEEVEFLSNLPVMNYQDFSEEDQDSLVAFFFLPDNPPTHDFKRFEALFDISDLLKQDESKVEWVEEKTYLDFLKRCASQNVRYVEFTKVMYPDADTFERLHTRAEAWYEETGVIVRWNTAFVRTLDFETNTEWTANLISILENNQYPELVGIDLLANEADTPALETGQNIYVPVLAANRRGTVNLHPTMHAGEQGLVSNVRDAMIMGVERVGHGVLLAKDPLALEYAVYERDLPIAINIYSNYRLRVNEDFSAHPFLDFLRLGLPVSLSTDDEGMFGTDIVNEYRIAISYTDITHEELKQMAYNSITTSFADEAVKAALLKKLDEDFEKFESQWHGEFN
jgi:adenosine deaminase CECR1